jgi:hypothetical protein
MLNQIRATLDRWSRIKEVDQLSDHDLDDLGMTRSQVTALITMPADVPDRVAAMAAIFNIPANELKANRADYLELLGTCADCRQRAKCTRLLQDAGPAQPSDAAFCPNAPIYGARAAQAA